MPQPSAETCHYCGKWIIFVRKAGLWLSHVPGDPRPEHCAGENARMHHRHSPHSLYM